MHLYLLVGISMDHRHQRAVVDAVHAVRLFVVCHQHDQDVDPVVLVETYPALKKMDCYQALPSDEEFPFPVQMQKDCYRVLEFQLAEFE